MERGAEVDGAREPFLAALPHSKSGRGGEVVGRFLRELVGSRNSQEWGE